MIELHIFRKYGLVTQDNNILGLVISSPPTTIQTNRRVGNTQKTWYAITLPTFLDDIWNTITANNESIITVIPLTYIPDAINMLSNITKLLTRYFMKEPGRIPLTADDIEVNVYSTNSLKQLRSIMNNTEIRGLKYRNNPPDVIDLVRIVKRNYLQDLGIKRIV